MKRSPLRRRTPLQRQQLQRRADDHLSRREGVAPRHKNTGPTPATRKAVEARDGSCVRCGLRSLNVWPPHQVHHRRPRGMGGTSREDSNGMSALILLCASCHAHIESHRTRALDDGYLVGQHDDPATKSLLWHGRRALLTVDGAVLPV